MEIKFSLDTAKVEKTLGNLAGGLKDYRKPFKTAGDDIIDYTQNKVFKTQGQVLGKKWKPLSASTLKARRERRGYYAKPPRAAGKILIWTGKLMDSFKRKTKRYELRVTNTTDYFKYHQASKGNPPQRRMLAVNKDVIKIVVKRINERIERLMK